MPPSPTIPSTYLLKTFTVSKIAYFLSGNNYLASVSLNMENDHDGSAPDHRGRGISPALSDISELTILSRSPSPVSQYKAQSILSRSWARKPSDVSDRRRGEDGRFLSVRKKRAHTPETEL
jgi:hypothetical protein